MVDIVHINKWLLEVLFIVRTVPVVQVPCQSSGRIQRDSVAVQVVVRVVVQVVVGVVVQAGWSGGASHGGVVVQVVVE